MNGRWQTYNKQREQHIQRLKRQLAEISIQSAPSSGGEGKLSAKQQEDIDQTIMQYKRKVTIADEEKQEVDKFVAWHAFCILKSDKFPPENGLYFNYYYL